MSASRRVVALCVLVVALSMLVTPTSAADQVNGSPDISVQSPTSSFAPGQEVTVPIYVSNDGSIQESGPAEYVERVTTARALSVAVRSGGTPIEVHTDRFPVGNVPEGTAGPVEVSLTIPENATPGTYRLPVRVRYSYTPSVRYGAGTDGPEYRNLDRGVTRSITVTVRDQPRFEVVDVASNARVGESGAVAVTIRNAGTEPARAATLELRSTDEELAFGGGTAASRAFEATWRPGENRTFEFRTRVAADAVARAYPLEAAVAYTDVRGIDRRSRTLTVGVEPRPGAEFAVEDVTGALYVGEPGTVRGAIRNTGPTTVENALLVVGSSNPSLEPVDSTVALGDLDPGERVEFAFDLAVREHTSPGPRQLNLSVRYRDGRGNRQSSEALEPSVTVSPDREWLAVTSENATFEVDSDNRMTVRIRNVENETLSDVRARLHTEEPFTSESRVAYVSTLDPGASATLAFAVTVSEDAVASSSSVRMNVTAERADGETIVLDTYVVPVTVVEDERADDTTILGAAAVGVVTAFIVGWWWLYRR